MAVAPVQAVVVWQVAQVVGYPADAWFDDLDEWRAAQPQLRETIHATPGVFLDAVRRCKLYDYEAHRWLDFKGRITAEIPLRSSDAL